MTDKLTPAQQQYMDLKKEHKDALLFFRLGDFYELFYEDAKIAHRELDITLTSRNKNSKNPIPMAGVPHHAAEKYIKKLLDAGYKIALADQVGKVIPGKVVERKIVRVVTPGTDIQEHDAVNNLVALYYGGEGKQLYHIAWGDISLGSFSTQSFSTLEDMLKVLLTLHPQEVIVDIYFPERDALEQYIHEVLDRVVSFDDVPHDTLQYLQTITGTLSLDGYGKALQAGREKALALLFSYSEKMQKKPISTFHTVHFVTSEKFLHLDDITIRNLEIFQSRGDASLRESLYGVINTCKTAMGSRLLYERLTHPIHDEIQLSKRLNTLEYYSEQKEQRQVLKNLFHGLSDLPRLLSKILYRQAQATKVQHMMLSLAHLLQQEESAYLFDALKKQEREERNIELVGNILQKLQEVFREEQINDEMGYIRDAYDNEIDELRSIAYHSDDLLLAYQKELITHTSGVRIKVKYVKNQGYCLEVTPKDIELFESYGSSGDEKFDFSRRQTLKTGQRYTTPYLSELEIKILEAKEKLKRKEMEILLDHIEFLRTQTGVLLDFFEQLGILDLATSFADFSETHQWTKPLLSSEGATEIKQGRHPVVEAFLEKTQQFIPNDCILNSQGFFHIITGPNMGGKSTFLRQNALIILLAHAGLYVPASFARIKLVDGIFARVGSGDALAKNQSTFMTEMLEMANILHHATEKSFVILDELGRGTSTYDGLALAKAISVYMCQNLKSFTLFATHYHELTTLSDEFSGCKNFSVSVYETDNEVVFLKKVVSGKASKSYGIDVAKLAGIPPFVLEQAKIYLNLLENRETKEKQISSSLPQQPGLNFGSINDEYKQKYEMIKEYLHTFDINEITPIEALIALQKIKKHII